MTIMKKNGEQLVAKIDTAGLETVQNAGTWFAEWNKDYNSYLVQSISTTKKNKKGKPLKQSLQNVVMNSSYGAPVRHINGDTLDNRKVNLTIFDRNEANEYEEIDENTIAILLKDKFGNVNGKALISIEDLNNVITAEYTWVSYKLNGELCVVANTPNGRIHLDRVIMKPEENKTVHHINLNPLDNRRENLEISEI